MKKDKEFFEKKFLGKNESLIDGKPFNFAVDNFRVAAEGLELYLSPIKKIVWSLTLAQ